MQDSGVLWAGIALLCANGMALAIDSAPSFHGEASMTVTGKVEIDASGAVTAYTVDNRRALDKSVVALLDRSVPTWRFEPVPTDTNAHPDPTRMSVFIVAKQISVNKYAMRIKSAHFWDKSAVPGDQISALAMSPPSYPKQAQNLGVQGTVYVALRIDRDGHVVDVIAEQANVSPMKSESIAARARALLVQPSLAAAKRWKFRPPTSGKLANAPFWTVRTAIQYQLTDDGGTGFGQWLPYESGPRQPIPWPHEQDSNSQSSPEGLVAGAVDAGGAAPHLLTAFAQE